ncbi:short-chain dehydrogenase [Haloprofundus marisrubri]|uniref:Short-chain dehydrogenase n=1 Tax=Haloprofundus marisrubri TaxID=1514971 RepID=A0A0W1RDT5_9EURY|nr:SDR family oxidoreductase [Haloprofundus marisrubri]KTG11599.1 short-chain dehydrogenase [Haloprofundus marisrubri]
MGVVVTGGSGSIGSAVVESLSGENVVFSYQTDGDSADALVEDAPDDSKRSAFHMDVTDADSVSSFFDAATDCLDSVDAVVHTVGVVDPRTIGESTDDQWAGVIETNLVGSYRVAQASVPHLQTASGSLIFLSSIGGTAGTVDTSYAASKSGLHGLVRALARELGPDGVRVNALAPGPVDTSMNDVIVEYLESTDFLGHENLDTHLPAYACPPEEIARAVRYLLDSSFTHGEILNVNGGMQFR